MAEMSADGGMCLVSCKLNREAVVLQRAEEGSTKKGGVVLMEGTRQRRGEHMRDKSAVQGNPIHGQLDKLTAE
jgi:hypothetical protein